VIILIDCNTKSNYAEWANGGERYFHTLEDAKAWCQEQIDSLLRDWFDSDAIIQVFAEWLEETVYHGNEETRLWRDRLIEQLKEQS